MICFSNIHPLEASSHSLTVIQFTNPAFLWALAGLAIPLGIHLLSRKEGKVIKLGSLRHVQETSTQQFKGIRLNETLLLILRCLLVILFTLLLAGMSWRGLADTRWLLIEKGLEKHPIIQPLLDSLKQGYEVRRLAEKFPLLEENAADTLTVNYRKLIEQIGSLNVSDVIIIAKNKASDFKGLRISLPPNVKWISQSIEPFDYTLQTIQLTPDSIAIRRGHTRSSETSFTTNKMVSLPDSGKITPLPMISIIMVADEKFTYDQQIINASLQAIEQSIPVKLQLSVSKPSKEFSPSTVDWCFWISDEKMPETSAKVLYMNPDLSPDLFVHEGKNQWRISKRLDEGIALKENMTMKLATLLVRNEELWTVANKNDRRTMPDSIAWAPNEANTDHREANLALSSADPYLLLLLLTVLLIERTVAYKRNQ